MAAQDEQPAHEVALGPFSIGTHEVSFTEYDRFARATGRALPDDAGWGRGDRPVINVTWDDAAAYAAWLSQETGRAYRLPTEAEWEYAARGGSADRYWWGFAPEPGRAVCFDCGSRWDNRSSAPVGSLSPNPFGLYDTAGNVSEWVSDCYNQSYQGAPADGSAWLQGDCEQRVTRGGAFNKPWSSLRSAARSTLPRAARLNMLGFRLVRE
jgi:formylglycine-generating enzyme required for sulfatase activity